jgi:phosphoribosylanthranilate isomerase
MYIGVTGFTKPEQVVAALASVPRCPSRLLMVGVLASYKTLQGEPAGNPRRYPACEDIAGIFNDDWRTLNLIHYNSRNPNEIVSQLREALEWGGQYCDGIQINIPWPDEHVVGALRRRFADKKIVLQVNQQAMQECETNAELVARRVSVLYGDNIDYVLIDPSGGTGATLEPVSVASYLYELGLIRDKRKQSFELIVAGGLCSHNLNHLLTPLRRVMPEVGIDVESGVRTDDVLDDAKVSAYIREAYALLSP